MTNLRVGGTLQKKHVRTHHDDVFDDLTAKFYELEPQIMKIIDNVYNLNNGVFYRSDIRAINNVLTEIHRLIDEEENGIYPIHYNGNFVVPNTMRIYNMVAEIPKYSRLNDVLYIFDSLKGRKSIDANDSREVKELMSMIDDLLEMRRNIGGAV